MWVPTQIVLRVAEAPPCILDVLDWQDFRELKARGYKPAWYPDALHTESGAALWLDAAGNLARWQQVGNRQFHG